jgi:hypothetical protein
VVVTNEIDKIYETVQLPALYLDKEEHRCLKSKSPAAADSEEWAVMVHNLFLEYSFEVKLISQICS